MDYFEHLRYGKEIEVIYDEVIVCRMETRLTTYREIDFRRVY